MKGLREIPRGDPMNLRSRRALSRCGRTRDFPLKSTLVVFPLLFFTLVAHPTFSRGQSDPRNSPLVLRGATLIDGTGSPPLPESAVVIRGDRIVAVGRAVQVAVPPGARVLDLHGKYLLPGFVDMHAHVTFLRNPGGPNPGYDPATSHQVLKLLLASGITMVRNPAAPTGAGVSLRNEVAAGKIPGPRILTAGKALNSRWAPPGGPYSEVENEDEVREEVRSQAAAGVDFIKVYSALPSHLVRVAIEAAHRRGIKVIGHLQQTTWTEAALMGIDAITHGAPWSVQYLPPARHKSYIQDLKGRIYWLDFVNLGGPEISEMIAELARRKVVVDPTLIAYHTKFFGDDPVNTRNADLVRTPLAVMDSWKNGTFVDDWSEDDFQRARRVWPKVLALTRLYYERGVPLTSGSDTPNPWVVPGAGLHRELELLVQAGIPPVRVLRIATRNGAEALGLLADYGTVEPRKQADMVVLDANPLEDIRNTRRISRVIQGGKSVWAPPTGAGSRP